MWDRIATFILKNRLVFLLVILAFAGAAGYYATKAEMAYDMQKLVPQDDPEYKAYMAFKKTFGEDGNKVVIGFQSKDIFKLPVYSDFYKLCDDVLKQKGVIDLISPARVFNLVIDSTDMYSVKPIVGGAPKTQEEVDSLSEVFKSLKFYDGLLYNEKTNVALMIVSLNDSTLNSKGRISLIQNIQAKCEAFGKKHNIEMRYSGLPFIRTEFATKVRDEIVLFTIIAFAVTALLILGFFRSISTLAVSLLFIAIGVVTMLSVAGLLGYKLTMLTGTLPPLLVVIGVQNTIYLINKYHEEYRLHGNKARALTRIISRIGVATFLINFTTAVGFGTFYFTKTMMLEQFGVVAFITINIIFFINIIGIPVLYSYLPAPTEKQTAHLDNRNIHSFLSWVRYFAFNKKRRIYYWSIALTVLSSIYIIKLRPLAYILDDVPKSSKIYKDLIFFQNNFKGVMPFEIVIRMKHTEESSGDDRDSFCREDIILRKMNKLQKSLLDFNEFSKPMSLTEIVCFANQVNNEGDPKQYRVPNSQGLGAIRSRLPESLSGKKSIVSGMVDSTSTKFRLSYQMADVGSIRMDSISKEVQKKVATILPEEHFDVKITGTSAIFLQGNRYLYDSLISSTLWSLLIISLTMGLLFPSIKMIIISVIPNVLPLLVTAGLMGYLNVPLKPSTILVFSIAFGITIDATTHFMSTFRRELLHTGKTLREALSHTIMEVGLSMIYTMVALFAGYMIFMFSRFEGTQALGWLTAVTLLSGLIANLFLLPALILTFEKDLNPKEELKETLLDLPEEDAP